MTVETGQLRVWEDAITLDKTPFLVVERVNPPGAVSLFTQQDDWRVLWLGKLEVWSTNRIKAFSEVIGAS